MAVVSLFVLVLIVVTVAATWHRPALARDAAWLAQSDVVAADEAEVYARYLARLRRHRKAGGMLGAAFAVVTGLAWGAMVTVGIAEHGPLTDLLWCGVAGVLLGALSAETYRLRLPRAERGGTVTASLAPRPALPGAALVTAGRALVGLALAGAVVVLAAGGGAGPVTAAIFAVALLVVCGSTRAAVRRRPRAALSDRALVVDANLRIFAGRTLAWLEATVGLLAVAWLPSGFPDGAWDGVGALVSVAALVAAAVCLVRSSPWPPRRVVPARIAAPEPQAAAGGYAA